MTKHSVLLLISVMVLWNCPARSQSDSEAAIVIWSASRELRWDDFRKSPPAHQKFNAQSWVALDISVLCVQGRFFYDVSAVFNCDSSWVKQVKGVDKLLRHEQGHFDLAEIAARDLRKALSELNESCGDLDEMKKKVNVLATYNRMQLNTEHSRYDSETRYGGDSKRQKKWEEKIARRIKELGAYAEQ
jgi:hypothetical protein